MPTPTAPTPHGNKLPVLSMVSAVVGLAELMLASHGGALESTLLDGAITAFALSGAAFAYNWIRGGGGGGGGDLRPVPVRVRAVTLDRRDSSL